MTEISRPTRRLCANVFLLASAASLMAWSLPAHAMDANSGASSRPLGWLVPSLAAIEAQTAPRTLREERAALAAMVAKRTPEDIARYRWWAVGGPVHRWNELLLQEMQESFVVLPMAARHLALLHTALDDAVALARSRGPNAGGATAALLDAALDPKITDTKRLFPPSEHAAAAIAAAEVLGHLFPSRGQHFAAKAEEAIAARLRAGVELPYAIATGRAIGRQVAGAAIVRAKADGSDAKWTGTVPQGPGHWKGINPIAPLAGTWRPWVLTSPSEFRPPAPPAVDSDVVKTALAELKGFSRTPKINHRAIYWEVHGGARAHTLWNEIARTKLLESGRAAEDGARVMVMLNVALADAGTACWDAKFTYWYIRPPQLDPEVKPLFAPPNHPSYPAAHGCFSTAAATVLASAFPRDRESLLALGKEAAEARIWAGIHYRFDIEVGQDLGRKVGERVIARAFTAG